MSNCDPNLPELDDLPDPNSNKTNINVDPPRFPSFPNLPGYGTLFKNFHLNLYDILMILFILWSFWKTGRRKGEPGAVEAPNNLNDFLDYIKEMQNEFSGVTSAYSNDININIINENTTATSFDVYVLTPLVYPEDKVNRFISIYNNYDNNNDYVNGNDQQAIMELMFGRQFTDGEFNDLYSEYRNLKTRQFITTSTLRRI